MGFKVRGTDASGVSQVWEIDAASESVARSIATRNGMTVRSVKEFSREYLWPMGMLGASAVLAFILSLANFPNAPYVFAVTFFSCLINVGIWAGIPFLVTWMICGAVRKESRSWDLKLVTRFVGAWCALWCFLLLKLPDPEYMVSGLIGLAEIVYGISLGLWPRESE